MSEITQEGQKIALDQYAVPLLPLSTDKSHVLSESVNWGPFEIGDFVTISITHESYVSSGDASVVATESNVLLPIGIWHFVIPTGVTHIALLSSWSGAVGSVWKS